MSFSPTSPSLLIRQLSLLYCRSKLVPGVVIAIKRSSRVISPSKKALKGLNQPPPSPSRRLKKKPKNITTAAGSSTIAPLTINKVIKDIKEVDKDAFNAFED